MINGADMTAARLGRVGLGWGVAMATNQPNLT